MLVAALHMLFLRQDVEVFNSEAIEQDQEAPHDDGDQPFPDTGEVAAASGRSHAGEHYVHAVENDTDHNQQGSGKYPTQLIADGWHGVHDDRQDDKHDHFNQEHVAFKGPVKATCS